MNNTPILYADDDFYWIAGRRISVSGRYNWIPSGDNINFFDWDVRQPKNGATDLCLVVSSYVLTGRWHDTPCGSARYFVCEK